MTPTPTTASNVGIIFTTNKKHVRAHVYVDSDAEWTAIQANLPAGFSLAFVPMSAHLAGHDTFHSTIATTLGLATVAQQFTDPRCVVIDNVSLLVESVSMLDDSVDGPQYPGKTLINHQIADVGHSYNPTTKQFTAPSFILPAKPGVRATAVVMPAVTFS